MSKKIYLSKTYYLVVGDCFELFYRSIIKTFKPNDYYIKATCEKGYTYQRYYTYTPKENEVGNYELTIGLYNEDGEVIEEAKTLLVVNKAKKPSRKINVLCIGDSLTTNGVWPYVGYSKYSEKYPDTLNFIGKMKKEEIGYEGYGGWQWNTFAHEYNKSQTSAVWVTCNHDKTDYDQHSVWENNGKKWVLETIEKDRLKFKRGENNTSVNPEIIGNFHLISDCMHNSDIIPISYDYSEGNPFINKDTKEVDFDYYITENKFAKPDYVFFLLTWNGQYKPYNTDFQIHEINSNILINALKKAFPEVKIGLLGIQPPCPNGGITACYGANGYYHDWYGETVTELNYNEFLENKALKNNDFMMYFDTKGQFDSEYNYYVKEANVNIRNSENKERIGVNGIHPSMNGYLQIGDSFYRALVAMINKFE